MKATEILCSLSLDFLAQREQDLLAQRGQIDQELAAVGKLRGIAQFLATLRPGVRGART